MKLNTIGGFLLLVVSFCSCGARSQAQVRTHTPRVRFVAEGRRGTFSDTGTGRHFRGSAFQTLVLSSTLQLPSAPPALLRELVVRFRTSPNGPSLRSIELRNGGNVDVHLDVRAAGDYTTREVTTPKDLANVVDFGTLPSRVYAQTVLRLEIAFPGGFDSRVQTGEFYLGGVDADFVPK